MFVGKCLSHLLCNPEAVRMSGDIEVQNAPSIVSDHKEAIKNAECEGWHREEIHRRDHFTMVAEKYFPSHASIKRLGCTSNPARRLFSPKHQIQASALHHECEVRPTWDSRPP